VYYDYGLQKGVTYKHLSTFDCVEVGEGKVTGLVISSVGTAFKNTLLKER
jgi:hypothetical protein